MPNIEVRGKYRTFRYDGDAPLDFTTYNNLLCVIRRPNINTFVTLQQYVPGQGGAFTSFVPGSSYTIVTRADGTQGNFNFDMGPYTRVDRLPSSTFLKSPNFYIGLDKNSIVVPISSYALSVNTPLSSIVNIVYVNGQGNRLQYVYADNFKTGAPVNFTHFLPNSGYELRNRIPFTFFAPLQSEMGDAWATGANDNGQLGMGYQYNSYGYTQLYGNWDKVVSSSTHSAALSTCGTKKKLFVCGANSYSQLGLTPLIGYTTQRAVTAIQTVWTEVKNLYYHVWDPTCEGGCYYEDALANETIQDVEVGDHFTLVKTDQYLYGIGNMYALGIAPPGDPSCCPQFEDGYNNTDPVTNYYYNTFLKYFTRFLKRSTSTLFSPTTISINDQTLYNEIQSSRLQKFQARGPRWWALYDNKLYACGKIGGTGASLNNSSGPIIPMGLTVGSLNNNTTFREIFALNNPANWNKTYTDFEASRSTVVALSSDNKRWLIGGRRANTLYMTSLSTMCFYDSQQNSYVPQNDYGLRLFPTIYGAMGIKDGTLYFTPNPVNNDSGGSALFGLGGNKTIDDMPSSSLPKINTALSPNPDEQVGIRSLVPVRYINPNSPNVSWKSLFVGFSYSCAIAGNNKFYICGSNSVGQLGLQQFPIDESSLVYTLSNVIPDNVYNVNANDNSAVIYKTNRNPAPSFTPVPSMTPTPTPTPTPTSASIYPETGGARVVQLYGTSTSNNARALRMIYSDNFDNWTYDTRGTTNPTFYGTLARLNQYPYGQFNSIAGCIPRGAAYTNTTKTLFAFQSFTEPSPFTYAIEIGKSDNTSGNPANSYNTLTFNKTILQTNTNNNAFDKKNNTRIGCFWDANSQEGNRMHIVYASQNSEGQNNIFAFTYDPITNSYSTPVTLESNSNSCFYNNFYTNNYYSNEQLVHKIANGKVYVPYRYSGTVPALTLPIKILIYDRFNPSNGWSSMQFNVSPAASLGSCNSFTVMNQRLAYWNDGSPVFGFSTARQGTNSCFPDIPIGDLYLVFNNNNTWQSAQRYVQKLWWSGASGIYGTVSRFTGYYTAYDMYVHPIENILHIIYAQEIQRTEPVGTNLSSGRHQIRLMKVNRQGTVLSDSLIFDCAVGPPAGNAINGSYYSQSSHLKSFYKSSTPGEFIPYFYVITAANGTGNPSYSRIFKYINGTFTQIYETGSFNPYGSNSGNIGAQTIVFT